MSNQSLDFSTLKTSLLSLVLERAYTFSEEPFVLSSGGTSHDYVDMRRGMAQGDALTLAARTVIAAAKDNDMDFEAIGGMTMGADPVAHAVAMTANTAWYSVRKAEKEHGSKRRIEGAVLSPDVAVIIFEDTVSTGRSLIEALDVVVESGAQIVGAITLLDRGDTASKLLNARGVHYLPILTYADLGIASLTGSAG